MNTISSPELPEFAKFTGPENTGPATTDPAITDPEALSADRDMSQDMDQNMDPCMDMGAEAPAIALTDLIAAGLVTHEMIGDPALLVVQAPLLLSELPIAVTARSIVGEAAPVPVTVAFAFAFALQGVVPTVLLGARAATIPTPVVVALATGLEAAAPLLGFAAAPVAAALVPGGFDLIVAGLLAGTAAFAWRRLSARSAP